MVGCVCKRMGNRMNMDDITLIIPIRIDHQSRMANTISSVDYHTSRGYKLMIQECDTTPKVKEYIDNHPNRDKITYTFVQSTDSLFYRTRHLNDMLLQVSTKYTVCFDIDMIMTPKTTFKAIARLDAGADMVLPYAYGCHMLGVSKSGSSKFRSTLDENSLPPSWRIFKNLVPYSDAWGQSDEYNCGAVQFFKTSSYLLGGGENEFYVDYAPEDKERIHRFLRLGYRVEFLDNCAGIWHLNHDSSSQNHKKLTDNRMRYLFDLGKSKEEYAEYIKTFPRYQEMQSKYARLTSGG